MPQSPPIWISITALYVSILAFCVGAFSLGWNIYRDVVLKPRLRSRINVMNPLEDGKLGDPLIIVSGTNHGPGIITCTGIVFQFGSFWERLVRRPSTGIVNLTNGKNVGDDLPRKLDRSEEVTVVLPLTKDCLLSKRPFRVGFYDSFAKNHWVDKLSLKRAVERYDETFKTNKFDAT